MKRMAGVNEDEDVDSTINIKIGDNYGKLNFDYKFNLIFPSLHTDSSDSTPIQLKLKRSQNLIDKSFVFISRNQNQSDFIADSFNIAQKFGDCLYRSDNSAFDLCDHEIVSRWFFLHAMSGWLLSM